MAQLRILDHKRKASVVEPDRAPVDARYEAVQLPQSSLDELFIVAEQLLEHGKKSQLYVLATGLGKERKEVVIVVGLRERQMARCSSSAF